jgi:integrase
MWALRYRPTRAEDLTLLRLLVLSRNLTRDRSWDISLRLDGELTRRPDAKNRPLFDLLTRLPDLAVAGISDEARALTADIAEDIRQLEAESVVDDGLTCHGLRSSCATALAEVGCSAHEIMAVLGHTTLEMAQKYTKEAERRRLAGQAFTRLLAAEDAARDATS